MHGVQLGQAAGLEAGGHQQHVRTGVDPVGAGFVVLDAGAEHALVGVLVIAEGVLIFLVAGAQHHHLGVAVHDLGHDGVHQIQALLVGQAGDQANHQLALVLHKAQLLLQGQLVLGLALQHVGDVVVHRQRRVGGRVPHAVVDAVHDAPQLVAVVAQVILQLLAVFRGLDLPGVGVAHGGDPVGVGQAALEHVGVPPGLLQSAHVEHLGGQPAPVADGGNVVDALEPQVMDGEHGLGAAHRRILEQGAQIHRHQRGLPVVAVDHVGNPVHVIQRSQRGLAEEAVLGNVVHQAHIGVAIGEELLIVDEVVDHAVADVLHDAHIVAAAGLAQIHVEFAPVDHLVLILLRDAGVAGQDDPHVAVLVHQLAGQRVHHIAQAAGLDEGMALGADEGHASAGGVVLGLSGCGLRHGRGRLLGHRCGYLSHGLGGLCLFSHRLLGFGLRLLGGRLCLFRRRLFGSGLCLFGGLRLNSGLRLFGGLCLGGGLGFLGGFRLGSGLGLLGGLRLGGGLGFLGGLRLGGGLGFLCRLCLGGGLGFGHGFTLGGNRFHRLRRFFSGSRSTFCFGGLFRIGLRFFLCHNNSSFQMVIVPTARDARASPKAPPSARS